MIEHEERQRQSYRKVLRLLDTYGHLLSEAGAPKEILDTYSRITRFLRTSDRTVLGLQRTNTGRSKKKLEVPSGETILAYSLDEIERLATDESTARKILEEVAVQRFNVPKGSLRSLSNMTLLRQRIMTHVQNERAHQTIGSIAKNSGAT